MALPPTGAPHTSGVSKKIAVFDRSRSLRLRHLTAKNVSPSATVVLIHDSALAEEYTVSSTSLLVVKL